MKPLNISVKFFGKFWRIFSTKKLPDQDLDGVCLPLYLKQETPREVAIHSAVRGRAFFETLLHEMIHAAFPWLDEDWVTRLAKDFSKIMYRDEILQKCRLRRTDVQD